MSAYDCTRVRTSADEYKCYSGRMNKARFTFHSLVVSEVTHLSGAARIEQPRQALLPEVELSVPATHR